jgi:serine protease Do
MLTNHPFRSSGIAVFTMLAAGLAASAQPPGPARAGYLGILLSPPEQAGAGIMVRDVAPDSPAAKAGVKTGDHIVKLGDEETRDVEKFLRDVASKKPGEKITLVVLRDGKEQSLTVTLGNVLLPSLPPWNYAVTGVQLFSACRRDL